MDGAFIGIIALMIIFIFSVFFGIVYTIHREKKKKQQFAKKLEKVYNNIYSKDFDAEAFIEEHKTI